MVDRAAGKVSGYRRREPEKTQLHRVVQDTWLTFRDNLQGEGGFLPAFVATEFEAYLGCGILGKGFVNVRCEACAETRLVAFSCKRRGADGAARASLPHGARATPGQRGAEGLSARGEPVVPKACAQGRSARRARDGRRDGDSALRLGPCAERSLSFRSDRWRVPCRHARSARILRHAPAAR
ncbi:MAG: transposase zinc-binding domain-containing protein [Myxococcales bacterium]|nr:transposase zinc-binding domain-containing protein [Myxococcales bacterium]